MRWRTSGVSLLCVTSAAKQRLMTVTMAKRVRSDAVGSWQGYIRTPRRGIADLEAALVTQQLAIAAGDQVTPLTKEAGNGKTGRGDLPFIAIQVTGTEQDLGDLLLGRAVEGGVGGLEDTPQARFLLRGQAGVAGD